MTEAFLQHNHLFLTPLSPIHLGCGEDYQPTNYVINNGALYAFDPAKIVFNDTQYRELASVAKRADILSIQQFFKKHTTDCIHSADFAVGVSKAIENEYQQKLGKIANSEKSGGKVINQLEIARTASNQHSHQPYIPGSALKGCVRTAVQSALAKDYSGAPPKDGKDYKHINTELLGSCATDALRLLKCADLMPMSTVATQIVYATNHKKKQPSTNGKSYPAKGITQRCETIQHGQYRAFAANSIIQHLDNATCARVKNPKESLPKSNLHQPEQVHNWTTVAKTVNRYQRPQFEAECALLEQRNLVDTQWLQHTRLLLAQIDNQLNSGHIMLVRLGKFGGAESKTIRKWAKIKINHGPKNAATYERHTTTVWLASQSDKSQHNHLPFGWALIEIDPNTDHAALQHWCALNQRHLVNTTVLQQQLQAGHRAAQEKQQQLEAEHQRIAAAQAQAAQQQAQKAAALAAMSPCEKLIAQWQERLQTFQYDARNAIAHQELYHALLHDLQQAAANFNRAEQQQLAQAMSVKAIAKYQPSLLNNKREKEIKGYLRQLRGEQ